MLVLIQSEKRSVLFKQQYHLHPSWAVECSAPVSCKVQQHWKNLQVLLLQNFLPWTLYICWAAEMLFGKLPHRFKIKRVSFINYTYGCIKNRYHVLYSLQTTFPSGFPKYYFWCCTWPVSKVFMKHFLQSKFCKSLCMSSNLCLDRLLEGLSCCFKCFYAVTWSCLSKCRPSHFSDCIPGKQPLSDRT